MVLQLTSNQLKEKIQSGETFILDLFATWCGPCKVMLNNLKMIDESDKNKNYKIYAFDVDSDREFVKENMKIWSVPTIKIYKNKEEVFSKAGVMSVYDIINEMSKY
jgi:thioredoxin 1